MTNEAKEALLAAAQRYNDGLRCAYPGCNERPVPRVGTYGRHPRYCALPEHNMQTAFDARKDGQEDPMHALVAERDQAIREVHASGGATYREIAAIELFGLKPARVAQICRTVDDVSDAFVADG